MYSNIIRELRNNSLVGNHEIINNFVLYYLPHGSYCMHVAWFLEIRSTASTCLVY